MECGGSTPLCFRARLPARVQASTEEKCEQSSGTPRKNKKGDDFSPPESFNEYWTHSPKRFLRLRMYTTT
jgi:hypothetical protein